MEDETVEETSSSASPDTEVPTMAWKHLAPRSDSWRRQFYVKDRNMTVGQLISTVLANKETPQQASDNLDLPLEVIQEAFLYFEQNKELIQQEAAAERQYLRDHGCQLEPRSLS